MINCLYCQQETSAESTPHFPACNKCNISYEIDNDQDNNILNILFLSIGQYEKYSLEIDLRGQRTILWSVEPGTSMLVKEIMVFNYVVPIKGPNDIEHWISRLLNLKAFS
jgi:hypothetical protein